MIRDRALQIRYHCPNETCVAIIEYEPLEEVGPTLTCPRCQKEHPLTVTDALREDHVIDVCAVCGSRELFIRKDFPQRIGLMVVIVSGIASIIFFRSNLLLAYAILAAAVVVDLLLYLVIGKATTCYACRAEYRNANLNPNHEGFDLATSDKY